MYVCRCWLVFRHAEPHYISTQNHPFWKRKRHCYSQKEANWNLCSRKSEQTRLFGEVGESWFSPELRCLTKLENVLIVCGGITMQFSLQIQKQIKDWTCSSWIVNSTTCLSLWSRGVGCWKYGELRRRKSGFPEFTGTLGSRMNSNSYALIWSKIRPLVP